MTTGRKRQTERMRTILAAVAGGAMLAGLGGGCAHSTSATAYTRAQARVPHDVLTGTVEAVKPVKIEGTRSGKGATVGAVAGAVGGAQVGHGAARVVGGLGGAAVGAVAGAVGEELVTRESALQITVRLPDGRAVAVVQKADETFLVGERVVILRAPDGTLRVQH